MAAVSLTSGQEALATTYPGDHHLGDQAQQVPLPQLVALPRQGCDGVLPVQVDQHERRPEVDDLPARLARVDREVAEHEDGHRVSR